MYELEAFETTGNAKISQWKQGQGTFLQCKNWIHLFVESLSKISLHLKTARTYINEWIKCGAFDGSHFC